MIKSGLKSGLKVSVKKLLTLLLMVFAMFYTTPRDGCVCSEAVAKTDSSLHACCKRQSKIYCCQSDNTGICKRNACCGMTGKFTAGLASSISILPESSKLFLKLVLSDWLSALGTSAPAQKIAQMNRAPPRLVGMGTSKTYLFKRTFLI